MFEYNKNNPERLAWSVLQNCLPRISPPVDLYAIANKLNIKIEYVTNLGAGAIEGVSIGRLVEQKRVIVLREDGGDRWPQCCRMNFTLAHELGHIILSETLDEETAESVEKEESFINRFASGLLIPIVLLVEHWNDVPCEEYKTEKCSLDECPVSGCEKINILARRFGVSREAMRLKILHFRQELREGIECQRGDFLCS